jgi:hypothetical protein
MQELLNIEQIFIENWMKIQFLILNENWILDLG